MPIEQRILLVDDDREFSNLLCRRLVKCGYLVTELHHPRQALEATSQRNYEVAVLDRGLPEIDGIRLMHMLKGRVANVQIIFLSGNDDPAGKDDAIARGAFAYLTKPCRFAEIEATIEGALEYRALAPVTKTKENAHLPTEPTGPYFG